ncbi:hypothetical protein [Trichormus azollae]|nr:hypothetical protein [Trichormus azollae]
MKPDPTRAGLVALIAVEQADKHNLSGLPTMVDFVSLYVKY